MNLHDVLLTTKLQGESGGSGGSSVSFGNIRQGVKLPKYDYNYRLFGVSRSFLCECYSDYTSYSNYDPNKIYKLSSTFDYGTMSTKYFWEEITTVPKGYSFAHCVEYNGLTLLNTTKGSVAIATSIDASSWNEVVLPEGSRYKTLCRASCVGGFLALAQGTDNHAKSSDGVNWTSCDGFGADTKFGEYNASPLIVCSGATDIHGLESKIVALNEYDGTWGAIYVNGKWQDIDLKGSMMFGLNSLICAKDKWIAGGDYNTPMYSEDGITWYSANSSSGVSQFCVVNNKIVGISRNTLSYSEDGVNYYDIPAEYRTVVSHNDYIVSEALFVDMDYNLHLSSDGITTEALTEEVLAVSQNGENITEDFSDLVLSQATVDDIKGLTDALNDITNRLSALENE